MRLPLRNRPTQLRAGRLVAQGPQGFAPCLFPRGVFYSAGHPAETGACEPRALRRTLPHYHDQEREPGIRRCLLDGKLRRFTPSAYRAPAPAPVCLAESKEAAMRRYKVEITRNGEIVHSCEVSAVASEEAKDEAWRTYDPDRKIGLFDTTYNTMVEELDA